jgi:3' terminal RNA ribose 2'-O-methyltransferase Hen1
MLLTITTTRQPATDLGFLLHKHPDRFQSFDLSFGKAHVFYSEAGADRCTACLLLDVDPVGMVRGKNPNQNFLLGQYVNDRPYAASSFLSVAIAQVFGAALQGRCKDRPDLASTPIPLTARIEVLPVRRGERFLQAMLGLDQSADDAVLVLPAGASRPADSVPRCGQADTESVGLDGGHRCVSPLTPFDAQPERDSRQQL